MVKPMKILKSNPELKYSENKFQPKWWFWKYLLENLIVLVSESIFYGTLLCYSKVKKNLVVSSLIQGPGSHFDLNIQISTMLKAVYFYVNRSYSKALISVYILVAVAAAAAKSLQSCLTLCDPVDGSPPGSPIPGILQARTLEWVANSFSNEGKWKVKGKSLSRVQLFETP